MKLVLLCFLTALGQSGGVLELLPLRLASVFAAHANPLRRVRLTSWGPTEVLGTDD